MLASCLRARLKASTQKQPRCTELGLPVALATELFNFLNVRMMRHSEAGPSSAVDELWHWMLLNTDVASEVHSLLGCVVRHSTASASAPPRAKLLRRLRSLNLMLAAGYAPREELWREPNVRLTKLPVLSASSSVPTGRYVFAATEAPRRTPHPDIVRFVSQNFCAPGEGLAGRIADQVEAGALGKRAAPEGQVVEQRRRVEAPSVRAQSCQPGNADNVAASVSAAPRPLQPPQPQLCV
jgi:hypothetical protein